MAATPISRRKFLAMGALALTGAMAGGPATIYFGNEANQVSLERRQIPIQNLPAGLEGFKIAQLSDIHLGPLTKIELVKEAVRLTNSLNPDVVVLTGDYIWREASSVFDLTPVLAQLNARHGIFSILGNHDVRSSKRKIVRTAFQESRLPLLENQGVTLAVGQDRLYLAGLDDGLAGHPHLKETMANWPNGVPAILLLHEPDLADHYANDRRFVLQLSGHSHGGQIRTPNNKALILPYLGAKYDMGLFNVNGMWLYTNRGLGVTNEPFRFNCPPEVTELTLVRA